MNLEAEKSTEKLYATHQPAVDQGLVVMFLRMTVEERLAANDSALRTIEELRAGFRSNG